MLGYGYLKIGSDSVQYRLDKYGNPLSVLGFGCMRFQRRAGSIDMAEAEREIMLAYENGVNYYEIYVMNTDGSNLRMLELPQPSQTPYG